MSAEFEVGDYVEWQGETQMMAGLVAEIRDDAHALIHVYDGDTRPENRSEHTVELDRLRLISKGNA